MSVPKRGVSHQPNRSNMRYGAPINNLKQSAPAVDFGTIRGIGLYCLCSDKKIREVQLTSKLGQKILGLIKQHHDGKINLNQTIFEIRPISRREGRMSQTIYWPLCRQLENRKENCNVAS